MQRCHICQTGGIHCRDKQRVFRTLTDILDSGNLPVRHFLCGGHFTGFALHGLTDRECHTGSGLGQIFTQHQHRIIVFHLTQ